MENKKTISIYILYIIKQKIINKGLKLRLNMKVQISRSCSDLQKPALDYYQALECPCLQCMYVEFHSDGASVFLYLFLAVEKPSLKHSSHLIQ